MTHGNTNTAGQIAAALPYGNTLVIKSISVRGLKSALENSVEGNIAGGEAIGQFAQVR
ncbi:hypothetical protein VOLCADRAFT_65472 [Volvox carteri f. nagariensis]|uniref:Uncharacterized protein n=1 Tax=Volvox carteri f. nagariensis TaxID=3068 RepID=D8U917_VOLCA|nr:uncharacterized protein VOLCADRAFT_65472 [Volvox carteri f. nagariensis]EFJ43907.1 hypothetical protein VOLCADRAFT_65472 [Volvox carteri f. nagariensis]|eukprot:XP_002955153.1 hypothetical protein VOLCADRAFT_65472 [Volvox carteri f. nagariensis]